MRLLTALTFFFLITFTAGCASTRLVEPETGLAADYQRAVSMAIESGFDPSILGVDGGSVTVEVVSLVDGRYMGAVEGYIKSVFEEAVAAGGGRLSSDGDKMVTVMVTAVGDIKMDRNLQITFRGVRMPFYYSGGTRALFDVIVYVEDVKTGETRVVGMRGGTKVNETYLLRVFGPYEFGL